MPDFLLIAAFYVVSCVIQGACLYLGAKLFNEILLFRTAVIIVMIGSVFSLFANFLLSLVGTVVMVILLKKFSTVESWKVALGLLILGNILTQVLIMFLSRFIS